MISNKFQDNNYRQICSEKTLQSNSQGFFLNFYHHVAAEVGEKWIKTVFGKLKSDSDRIRTIYTSTETKELLHTFLSNVQEVYRGKNAEFSQKKRSEAEELLKNNDYEKSLLIYSQSVLRAPKTGEQKKTDSGLTLSLALWGRSQALIKLHKSVYALTDIQQALKENLPESYKARAFWNMAICYKGLKEENKAKVSFDIAEKLLQGDQIKLALLAKDRTETFEEKGSKLVKGKAYAIDKVHPTIPNASQKLSLKSSKIMGRYMVANERIPTGVPLVVEPPYAACLLPEMFGTHCQLCFRSLEVAYGCPDCSSVAFCSIACRNEALSTYHKYECRYLDLLIGSGMSILGHTAMRMVTQSGLERCLEIYQNKNKEKIYELCTNDHLRGAEDFLQRTLMAAFLLGCLQKSGFFGKINNDRVSLSEAEYKIGEMLLFNLQMLQFNAHEIYETRHGPEHRVRGSKSVYIGVAVYLTASLFNHDCHPALSRHFVGKNIVLITTRVLEPNQLVPENYGPIFTRRSLKERKMSLSSRYWFDCQCLACQQNWPPISGGLEDFSKRLRCPTKQCKQIFTLPAVKNPVKCPKCDKTVDLSSQVQLLDWCKEQYDLAFGLMDQDETQKAIDILCVAIDTFYRISLPPNKDTCLAEEMLRTCFADSGNTWKILVKPK